MTRTRRRQRRVLRLVSAVRIYEAILSLHFSQLPTDFKVPANCSTPFWDPIGNKCICNSTTCSFSDDSRPIGVCRHLLFSIICSCVYALTSSSSILQPNGANLTGGGTGGAFASDTSSTPSFVSFNGVLPLLPVGVLPALAVGLSGALLGAAGVYGRLSL